MSKTNREHSPVFKAQVALAAIKGDQANSHVAAHDRLHVNLVSHGKRQLRDGAAAVFSPTGQPPPPDEARIAELDERIGRLQVELAFAEKNSAGKT